MKTSTARRQIVCTYKYADESGTLLYEVVRYEPKDFRTRRPLAGGGVSWSLKGVRKVLYNLPAILKRPGEIVYVVEGEKDADTLSEFGLLATTCQGSANGWLDEFATVLKGRRVVILPDNDDAGIAFARVVAVSLLQVDTIPGVVQLPGLAHKGDVTDWFTEDGTTTALADLASFALADQSSLDCLALASLALDNDSPADATADAGADRWTIKRTTFADIVDEDLAWLWEPLWLDHSVNILTGPPGVGKTFVACHLAAAISTGAPWPDGPGNAAKGDVVYLSTEDSLSKVLKKRLFAAGADLTRVHTWTVKSRKDAKGELIEQEVTLEDIEAITKEVDDLPDLRLLIVDPVTAYLGTAEANDNQEVRRVLNLIVKLAESKKFCVVLITHQKKSLSNAINSTMGAQSFVAVSRVVNGLFKDPDDEERRTRCLVPFKNNHGADVYGKRFRLVTPDGRGSNLRISWDEEPEMRSADDIMSATASTYGQKGGESKADECRKRNESTFLDVLDKMTKEAGQYVPVASIKLALGWSGTRMSAVVWSLTHDETLESREGTKEMPNGGEHSGGRQEVRRTVRKIP